MRRDTQLYKCITLTELLFTGFTAGSIAQDTSTIDDPEAKAPFILTTISTGGETNSDSAYSDMHHDLALKPGVHRWDSSIQITSDGTLSGSEDDVWVFKTGNDLTVDENIKLTLNNGARTENIFWVAEGGVTIDKDANIEGVILSINEIALEKGAKLNGRMFSQTSVTLGDSTVTEPVR